MAELKREYVIPLRKKTLKAPRWRRSKKAISVIRDFLKKHMKVETIVICNELNEKIWANGIKNPPGKVDVIAVRKKINDKEVCIVNLKDKGIEKQIKLYEGESKEEPKKKEKESVVETKEEIKEDKKEEANKTVKKSNKKASKKEVKENE